MARLTDAVLAKNRAYATTGPAIDLRYGGQGGYLPRYGSVAGDGKIYEEWVSNHLYVRQNIIPVLLRYPKFFDYMPDKQYYISAFKSIMEEHPISIEGLNTGITVETDEEAVGTSGEQMEVPTGTKRNRSQISITVPDKAGKVIQKFYDIYIRYGIADPDTQKPLVSQFINTEKDIGIYTPDLYTAMMLYIEPDITHQVVNDAWMCFNMFPKGNGDRTGTRDIKSTGEMNRLSIEFTSITLNNIAVIQFAQRVMSQLMILRSIPDTDILPPINNIDPSVEAISTGFGRKAN